MPVAWVAHREVRQAQNEDWELLGIINRCKRKPDGSIVIEEPVWAKTLFGVAGGALSIYFLFGSIGLMLEKGLVEALPMLALVCFWIWGTFAATRLSYVITDRFIEQRRIRTTRITYSEIRRLHFDLGRLQVMSDDVRIDIVGAGDCYVDLYSTIATRVGDHPDLQVTGDEDMIDAFFPNRKPAP